MGALREYAMTLMTTAVIGCVLKLVLPDKGIKKALCWLISLVMIMAAAAPVKEMIENLTISTDRTADIESAVTGSENYSRVLLDTSVRNIEKGLAEAIKLRYGAAAEIKLTVDAENMQSILITRVSVTLSDSKDARKSPDIGRWLSDMMGCEAEIITEERSENYRFAV
ncbi:MAG: hypothetical protein J6I45_07510 [Clostridia bacterium]|nr:hypothetical protein [Clostridia bacterium]